MNKNIIVLLIVLGLSVGFLIQAQESSLQASVNVLFNITIVSPINKTYNNPSILTNISLNGKAIKLSYSLDGIKFKLLCTNCDSYAKALKFAEGLNNLTVKAIADKAYFKNIEFSVDSIAPKLKKSIASSTGVFNISYTEANPVRVFLNYGLNSTNLNNKKELLNCPYGSKLDLCSTSTNVSSFNGKTLYYSFSVNDTFYSSSSKKPGKILINIAQGAKYMETTMGESYSLSDLLRNIADFFR